MSDRFLHQTRAVKKIQKKFKKKELEGKPIVAHLSARRVALSQVLQHVEAKDKVEKYSSLPGVREAFIPYLVPNFMKGTQIVELRLPLTAYKISVANATAYTTVLNLTAAAFNNFTDCANLFDEYRVVRGHLEYHCTYANTANNVAWGGASIDYSIAAAYGSFDAMYSHDTHVIGNYTNYNSKDVGKKRFSWPLNFEPMPDQDWIPTTTTSTVFAYWKPYLLAATINATEDCGHLLGWIDFQFRGMAA
jgi:hypothetical protein